MNKIIAAKIEWGNISLLDRNGSRIGYAGSPGMAFQPAVQSGQFCQVPLP